MATLEKPAAETEGLGSQQSSGGEGGNRPDDNVRLHPFLYLYPGKTTVPAKLSKQLAKLAAEEQPQKKQARAYLTALDEQRQAAASALESAQVSASARQQAVEQYLGLLQGLVGGPAAASAAPPATAAVEVGAEDHSLDAALAEAEAGTSSSAKLGSSKLRYAATFQWADALLGSTTTSSSDALFELASVIMAAALAASRQAAQLCEDSATGVFTLASTEAYTLLRQGAGALDLLAASVLPCLPPTPSEDLNPQVVSCLSSLLLADAQSLTVLRAVAKGNQPALIASLSLDTASLYRQAGDQLARSTTAGNTSSKLAHYLQYRRATFEACTWLFTGIDCWQAKQQAGLGLRCLQEAALQVQAMKKAASLFDAAHPASMNLLHRRHDELLTDRLADVQRRMKREAEQVYYQPVAQNLPQLHPARRLVTALPFVLPPPAAMLVDGTLDCFASPSSVPAAAAAGIASAGGTSSTPAATGQAAAPGSPQQQQPAEAAPVEQGGSFWRWALFLIAMPLLLIISLVGCVVWIVLLPLKIFCCPIGCLIQLMWSVMEGLIKMPLRWMAWAAGKPWQAKAAPEAAGPAVKQ